MIDCFSGVNADTLSRFWIHIVAYPCLSNSKGFCLEMNIFLRLIITKRYLLSVHGLIVFALFVLSLSPLKSLSNFENSSSNPLQRT